MPSVAVIAGDGIGPEVISEGLKVLRVLDRKFPLDLSFEVLDYGAERYLRDGTTLPAGDIDRFRKNFQAIFLGALGDKRVPDMRHAREILLRLRFELDLYCNFRPIRCLHDNLSPLKKHPAKNINVVVFRENTEGVYGGLGGNFKTGTPDEVSISEEINTRKGVERIIRAAFEYASKQGLSRLVMADKSNAMPAHQLWQRVFAEYRAKYPAIQARHLFIDALAMELIRDPSQFDVIVTNNLFGDIITDLGAQLQGGMGMAASMSVGDSPIALFEPVHGSAPDIAGKGIANPLGAILTCELLLEHLKFSDAAKRVNQAVCAALQANVVTPDLGGKATTTDVGDFVVNAITNER